MVYRDFVWIFPCSRRTSGKFKAPSVVEHRVVDLSLQGLRGKWFGV